MGQFMQNQQAQQLQAANMAGNWGSTKQFEPVIKQKTGFLDEIMNLGKGAAKIYGGFMGL
jgi:hypothetical protein